MPGIGVPSATKSQMRQDCRPPGISDVRRPMKCHSATPASAPRPLEGREESSLGCSGRWGSGEKEDVVTELSPERLNSNL